MITGVTTIAPLLQKEGVQAAAKAVAGPSFGSVMGALAAEAATSLKAAEAASIAGIQGKAAVHEVVDSILIAERSLQTIVAVRDKAIAAYQDISRMQI